MTEKLYLAVAPDEPYMPVRLHFVIGKQKVYDLFQKLSSVDYDKKAGYFDWFWEKSPDLPFAFDNSGVPEGHDLLLAQMKFLGANKLHIICNSYKKAIAVLHFFSKKLSSKYLRLVEMDMCNWVYEATEETKLLVPQFGFDFFEQRELVLLDGGKFMRYAEALEAEGKSPEEALDEAGKMLEEEDKQPYPEYHKRIIGPSKEDRETVPLILMLVQRVANQRFADGNCEFGMKDAAAEMDGEYGEE